jgi:hypothetical protein
MYGNAENTIISKLEELFTESIFPILLNFPILWGQHTFSKSTINNLTIYYDKYKRKYITHPYTRARVYVNKINELPENIIIKDLILIFLYCKTIEGNKNIIRKIFIYFIKALLTQQKKLDKTNHLLDVNEEIQDILLRDIVELLKYKKNVIKILSTQDFGDKNNYYKKYTPSNVHLNEILFIAIRQNNDRLIDILLSKKFNIDLTIKDQKEKTALHWACYYGQKKAVKMLLDMKADVNAKDINGQTPLYWACFNKRPEIVEMLLKYKADVNTVDINGKTPVTVAYNKGYTDLVEMLIDYGSRDGYNIKDQYNNTVMTWVYEPRKKPANTLTNKYSTNKKSAHPKYNI